MRDGLRGYWNASRSNRVKSMSLLSTADGRLHSMLEELAHVAAYSLGARIAESWRERRFTRTQTRGFIGLPRLVLRHAGEALRTT